MIISTYQFPSSICSPDTTQTESTQKDSSQENSSREDSTPKDSSRKTSTVKGNFLSKFFSQVFSLDRVDTADRTSNYSDFMKKEGKVIRKIYVKVLDLFGTSVYDTTIQPRSWLSKTGNAVHINTRDWLILDNLLFKEGDKLNSFQLMESERLLRQNSNIYDSRIVAVTAPDHEDSLDVYVFVQDIWSISGDASINSKIDHGYVSLKDVNFLGWGTEVSSKVKISNQYSQNWSWDGSLIWSNIKRSFFTGRISRRSEVNDLRWGFGANKDFFSPVVKWAGGIDLDWYRKQFWIEKDSLLRLNKLGYATFDVWGGYATDIVPEEIPTLKQNKFNFSARYVLTNYQETPVDDSAYFQNNSLVLGRIGYSYRSFYKDRFIFGLGRTEDIPVGLISAVIYGYESGQKYARPYYGIYSGYSRFNYNIGYFYAGFSIGAYRQDKRWQDGVSELNLLYISTLKIKNEFRWRHYLWARFAYTENPLGSLLNVNNSDGLRGAGIDKNGNKKVVLNYENNVFTPFNIVGFNIAFITFADLALLSSKNESLLSSKLYQAYGLGFRIRNEHLVTSTIQIMIGYYPGGSRNFNVFEQGRSFYKFDQFRFGKPGIINF